MRQQQDGLGEVAHLVLDEEGLVLNDQVGDVAAGNVAVVDDRESRGVEVETDGTDPAARNARANGAAVQHPGQHDVVGVTRGAGGLADPILPGHALADDRHSYMRSSAVGP